MPSANILAVASSVSADNKFDTLDALEYAIANDFKGFQAYINQQIVDDAYLRATIRSRCIEKHMALVMHAPHTLNWATATDTRINSAAKELFELESQVFVVHHYDETLSLAESLKCMQYLHEQGITTCLENYFKPGTEFGETSFKGYLSLLERAKSSGIDFMPVFDIPRIYNPEVKLVQQTSRLLKDAFKVFKSIETPIILHLIDTSIASQTRSSWCPIGQGIIPYVEIFTELKRDQIPIYMVILEFEDRENPIQSKVFLEENLLS